jgi:8-oxo-dGTP pyrophosphatase MutT (NUDIX family)
MLKSLFLVCLSIVPSLTNGLFRGAGVVILHENRVLLVQNLLSGNWGFPKGHREPSDLTWRHTAVREVEEETGYLEHVDYEMCSEAPQIWGRRPYWTANAIQTPLIRVNTSEHRQGRWIPLENLRHFNLNRDLSDWHNQGYPILCTKSETKIDPTGTND